MISVITWDASFRESFHTIDCFNEQSISHEKYEFIWVEYYEKINNAIAEKLHDFPIGRALCFNGSGRWHLGEALNFAISKATGDLLVIIDGDIMVQSDFLEKVAIDYKNSPNLISYIRRWDEPKPQAVNSASPPALPHLEKNCVLSNPTNYGGCLILEKSIFEAVGGYEENILFSEAGAIGMELYTRLKNAGHPIRWHPDIKIYHPWHSGSYPDSNEYIKKLELQLQLIKKEIYK